MTLLTLAWDRKHALWGVIAAAAWIGASFLAGGVFTIGIPLVLGGIGGLLIIGGAAPLFEEGFRALWHQVITLPKIVEVGLFAIVFALFHLFVYQLQPGSLFAAGMFSIVASALWMKFAPNLLAPLLFHVIVNIYIGWVSKAFAFA